MTIYDRYAMIGPWAVPAPASIALAGRVLGEWTGTNEYVAWTAAGFSLVALEVAGGLASYHAIHAGLRREWGWFTLLALGVIAYLILGIYALSGLTGWIYVVLAVFTHIAVAYGLGHKAQRTETIEDKTLDLAFSKEETKRSQADARKAKFTTQPAVPSHETPTNSDMSPSRDSALDDLTLKLNARQEFDSAGGDINAAALARHLGVPNKTRTIQRWIKEWKSE